MRSLPFVLFFTLVLGCAEPPYDPTPPSGWTGAEQQWWREGLDTTNVFRNLETLEDLNVVGTGLGYATDRALSTSSAEVRQRFKWEVKKRMLPLLRNQPELVDSLFEATFAPKIAEVRFTNDALQDVKDFTSRAVKFINRNHFQGPAQVKTLGEDVPIDYPDSLQTQRIGGDVLLQVYLDAEGLPQAIQLVEGGHHVLNNRAMLATTQMEWRPSYVFENKEWEPIPSWVRYRVLFNVPPE